MTVTASAGGQTITATIKPFSYTWTFGQPGAPEKIADTAGAPGSATSASATWTYVDMGTFEVSVTVCWKGFYVYAGTHSLGPVCEAPTYAPYEVREIKSVLSAGPG